MKEIEFRFWDTDEQTMIYYNPVLSSVQAMCYGGGHVYKNGKLQNWIPMQYVGLKDRSGKKMYEGDIVTEGVVDEILWDGDGIIVEPPNHKYLLMAKPHSVLVSMTVLFCGLRTKPFKL